MPCDCMILVDTAAGPMEVPGGQCLQCRITKQKALTWRCILEDRTSTNAEFWTLTFADAPDKPDWGTFSNFLKRYRQHQIRKENNSAKIRFFACGEYGEKSGRFHYHALLYNTKPVPVASHTALWPHGFVYIGTVTPKSIRYTARYCLKFGEKGKESVANWSTRPSLGEDGMRLVVQSLKRHKHPFQGAPSYMRHENSYYPLDEAMRLAFLSEWIGEPVKSLRARNALRNPMGNFLTQRMEKILDPEPLKTQSAYNSEFWAKIRVHYGKL